MFFGHDPVRLSNDEESVLGHPQAMNEWQHSILPTPPKGFLALAGWALCCSSAVDPQRHQRKENAGQVWEPFRFFCQLINDDEHLGFGRRCKAAAMFTGRETY